MEHGGKLAKYLLNMGLIRVGWICLLVPRTFKIKTPHLWPKVVKLGTLLVHGWIHGPNNYYQRFELWPLHKEIQNL